MFFLAKDQDLLVVEQVAALIQTEYPQDRTGVEIRPTHPILIKSDVEVLQGESDVEGLNPTKSRQSRYQTDNSYTMPPDSNNWVPVAYPPVSLGSLNSTISCSEVERIVKLDNYSASSALDRAEVIMKTKLNLCAMLQTASIKDIDGFREACKDVLKLVELKCKGIAASKFPPTMPVADVGLLGRVEMDGLLVRWQDEGFKWLKQTTTLLKDERHKKEFVGGSTVESIEMFKRKSFEVIDLVEKTCAGVKKRTQIR
ncbi:hypothetical protein PtB15_9B618 [Puccinia triticina]|nr:hypothetical protein PtB15_9B618 [Puccinia triticina]